MYKKMLLNGVKEACNKSMVEAVKEAVEENNGGKNVRVALYGTWQKRGLSSLNGLIIATSTDIGKDFEVLSKYCSCKKKKKC